MRFIWALLGGSLLITGPGHAQLTPGSTGPTTAPVARRIDGKFTVLRAAIDRHGHRAPIFGPEGLPAETDLSRLGATLRFTEALAPGQIAQLEDNGVAFDRRDGEVIALGTVYPVRVTWAALRFLEAYPGLVRAEASWRPFTLSPLEITGLQSGTAAARWRTEDGTDGTGVTVATIDSGVDSLHPHFFKADGEWFDWVDANGDGDFDLGTDGVDYDKDGSLDDNEVMRVLDAGTTGFGFGPADGLDGVLQPRLDWLYIDVNGDRRRNVGTDDGFTESDPAYGEPLFVVDDVNGNDALDPGEKVVQLVTSKISKLVYGEQTFTRGGPPGSGLIDAVKHPIHEGSFHGTGVASIIVGGQAGFHDRVGMAPGSEIISYSPYGEQQDLEYAGQARAIADALDSGARLIVHEWTDPFFVVQDGSTNLEAAMDAARNGGLIQVNPLGNLNVARKHAIREVNAGDSLSLSFEVGPGFQSGFGFQPYTVSYGLVMWQGDHNLTVGVRRPFSASTINVPLDGQYHDLGERTFAQAYWDVTDRGTRYALVFVFKEDFNGAEGLTEGAWNLELGGFAEADTVHARIADYYSSWGLGIAWEDATPDVSSAVFPSTADSAIGVAAYGGRHDLPDFDGSRAGELRNYSGRGPRIDGAPVVDIAASDDPYAAMAATAETIQAGYGRSWFSTFGGTSGAGPHVAGALALMAAHDPEASATALEDRLIATVDQSAPVPDYGAFPNDHWGYGRLDAYRAIYDAQAPIPDQRPDVVVDVQVTESEVIFDPSRSSDPEGAAMKVRFDIDYDGRWESTWQDLTPMAMPLDVFGGEPGLAKVQIRDVSGATHGLLVPFDPSQVTPPPMPDAGVSPEADSGPNGGSGGGAGGGNSSDGGIDVMRATDDGGCNCSTKGTSPAALLWPLLVLAGLARRRASR
ncbi:MAG: S8 family serine peptidase [Bradymonadia bacterium]